MHQDQDTHHRLKAFTDGWEGDVSQVKDVFGQLHGKLQTIENTVLSFKARPGVSYSLRAGKYLGDDQPPRLFALIDVIDDDPENRWLSVCFYDGTVSDPDQLGNLIPQGILGDDGYCFDVNEGDKGLVPFLLQKIDEAFDNTKGLEDRPDQ